MEPEIKYIELKSGYNDDGPAWIGKVEFSKTGRTIYFNGHAFKGNGHGDCYDVLSGERYWISGLKKDSTNRHWAGKGKIMIDRSVINEYLKYKEWNSLDPKCFDIVDIKPTDKQYFTKIENDILE